MSSHQEWLRTVEEVGSHFDGEGLVLRHAEDTRLDGRSVRMDGRPRINFGSCSYLGLELDPRLRRGAIDAIERYGTQFSSSRVYLSAPLYAELEALLDELFGAPTLVTPNTTLAHLNALPSLVGERDALLLDHQVHTTVRLAAQQTRLLGATLQVVPHNRLDVLEDRIRELRAKHEHVWYLADGVYSMHGDLAPMRELAQLLERYPSFRLYVDDAHGMSWCGRYGRGHALSQVPLHPHMVVATSLNKTFAAAGGALVLPDEKLRQRIRLVGGPMLFTGPLQPPMLGAAIASAHIHLSPEIDALQARLRERVRLFNRLATEHELPLPGASETPTRFVATGMPGVAGHMVSHLYEKGFWTNLATFPAVVARESGVRCALNLHQTEADVRLLVETIAKELPEALAREGSSLDDVRSVFPNLRESSGGLRASSATRHGREEFRVEHVQRFADLDPDEWQRLFSDRGIFSGRLLECLEPAVTGHGRPEDNWAFHYLTVRDTAGHPVAATLFSEVIWKDDVFAPTEVSRRVESVRRRDPYFLTSRVLLMGTPITEGNHLYLDRTRDWRDALRALLKNVAQIANQRELKALVFRDLSGTDLELDRFLRDAGFVRHSMPTSFALEVDWQSDEEWLARLTKKARRFQRREVLPWEDAYDVEVVAADGGRTIGDAEWAHLHGLYRNVWERNLGINTFPLSRSLLATLASSPGWELVLLRLRERGGCSRQALPDGFLLANVQQETYTPLLVGLDYGLVASHGLYRTCLLTILRRARALAARHVHLGMGAELEKRRFGATPLLRTAYIRADDHLQLDVMAQVRAEVAARKVKPGGRAADAPFSRARAERRAS